MSPADLPHARNPAVGAAGLRSGAEGPRRIRGIAALMLAAALVVRLALVFQSKPPVEQGLYVDDAFIAHKIAQNIADGKGIAQGGRPTNGFQPFYVFLLVPMQAFLDLHAATRGSGVMNAVLSVLGAGLVFRVLSRRFGGRVGLIGLFLCALSAPLARVSQNGLETTLALTLMLLVLDLHVRSRRDGVAERPDSGVVLGGALGLAVLARVDLLLLAVPVGIEQVWSRMRRGRAGSAAAMLTAAGLVAGPWFAWSWVTCGRLMPVSGPATRTIAQLYADPAGPTGDAAYFPLGEAPFSFYRAHLASAIRHVAEESPLSLPVRYVGEAPPWACLIWTGAWAIVAYLLHRGLPRDDPRQGRFRRLLVEARPAWVFCGLLVVGYACWCFGNWWMWRYMAPAAVLLVLPSALWVDTVLDSAAQRSRAGAAALSVALAAIYVAAAVRGHVTLFRDPPMINEPRMYLDALDLRDRLEPEARVGTFESGILDYFLQREVINLDGKTNEAAHRALAEGRMHELLDELRIDYVVSSPPLVRDLLLRRGHWPEGTLSVVGRLRHNVILRVMPPVPAAGSSEPLPTGDDRDAGG
ncbi:MAG: hypothetical protein FLDDKLPJ_01404 [Phycisphaerae bacterium]|nr:hypothetical protein [Phycisphaerae bacterium]